MVKGYQISCPDDSGKVGSRSVETFGILYKYGIFQQDLYFE